MVGTVRRLINAEVVVTDDVKIKNGGSSSNFLHLLTSSSKCKKKMKFPGMLASIYISSTGTL